MKNIRLKQNFIIIILVAFVFAAMFGLASVYKPNVSASAVSVGEGANPTNDLIVDLTLDVNGRPGPSDEQATDIESNNLSHYKTRTISVQNIATKAKLTGLWSINPNGKIYSPNNEFFSVKLSTDSSFLTFEAESPTIGSESTLYARIDLISSTNDQKSIFIGVEVDATFAHGYASNADGVKYKRIVVGNKTKNARHVTTMQNNTEINISLETLVGAHLYEENSSKDTENGKLITLDDTITAWTVKNSKSLEIKTVSIPGLSSNILKPDWRNPVGDKKGSYSPTIFFNIDITERALKDFVNRDFWSYENGDEVIFPLEVEILMPGDSSIKAIYFIKFIPATEPALRKTPGMPTSLIAIPKGLEESARCFTKDNETPLNSPEGYHSTRVYPDYLVNIAGAEKVWFNEASYDSEQKNSTTIRITPQKIENTNDEYYFKIDGLADGDANVVFTVHYKLPGQTTSKNNSYKISFKVYGNYTIEPILVNAKIREIDITSDPLFSKLTSEQFFLESARIADSKHATQTTNENKLIITPLETGITTIYLTFKSYEGKVLEIPVELNVDLTRGDWWRELYSWQRIAIIVGGIILAIALILFIIWLFIRGIAKSKRIENETVIPTSSYIIKLNSTIAANQTQQRLATEGYGTRVLNAPNQTLQLGGGPTMTAAPAPSTLQLNIAQDFGLGNQSVASQPIPPAYSSGLAPAPPLSIEQSMPNLEDIYIPLSDEQLIERIYIEKYEPRGMTRRSFFKSRDLQVRELEKEKLRIRDNVRQGMSIEEACKTDKQREIEANGGNNGGNNTVINLIAPSNQNSAPNNAAEVDPIVFILGFDPSAAVIKDDVDEKSKISDADKKDMSAEELSYEESKRKFEKLVKETEILQAQNAKAKEESNKVFEEIRAMRESCSAMSAEIKSALEESTDLEIKITSAKGKEKDRLSKELITIEERIKDKKVKIAENEKSIAEKEDIATQINRAIVLLDERIASNNKQKVSSESNLVSLEKSANLAKERAIEAKRIQEYEKRFAELSPILENVAKCDMTIRRLTDEIEQNGQVRSGLKNEVSTLQTQLLSASDPMVINSMSEAIKEKNKRVAELDKIITSATKQKSDLNVELSSHRKKANNYVDKENIDVEDIIKMEDSILQKLAIDEALFKAEKDKLEAEMMLSSLQELYDELSNNFDANMERIAAEHADEIQLAEQELQASELELELLNKNIEEASDDEKLMMSIDQMTLTEKIDDQKRELEAKKTKVIKDNLEFKLKSEEEISEANEALERAKSDYEAASVRISKFANLTEMPDLIVSASGLISQDRQQIEQNNLRKQLEKSQSAIEQAKLQAKMAQMEAEKAMIDAERASKASKEEAEKAAKEAIERAEKARLEAEVKALEEAEKAKEELERVKHAAAEEALKLRQEAEEAKKEALSETERLREEAESVKREIENVRKEAQSEAENAKREAEDEAMRARREAGIESERLAAMSDVERMRAEAEQAKREAETEAERAKREAEEEALRIRRKLEEEKADADAEAKKAADKKTEEEARIASKVKKRKEEIAALRRDLPNIASEDEGVKLKEKFYNLQLTFDTDEKNSNELRELIERSMTDALHAGEVARYKALAEKAPKRVVRKVTERVNKIQRPAPGARPAGARPGPRPAGARPAGSRPGPGARPASRTSVTTRTSITNRSASARPAVRPAGARPDGGARPAGSRPGPGARPAGAPRPAGARPANGARSTSTHTSTVRRTSSTRPSGSRPTE